MKADKNGNFWFIIKTEIKNKETGKTTQGTGKWCSSDKNLIAKLKVKKVIIKEISSPKADSKPAKD